MKTKFWLILLLAAFALGAIANSQSDGTAALLKIEGEFMKAAAEHGSQGYLSYYADDAVEVPNGEAFLQGKENIAKTMGFLDNKDNHLTWSPVGAGIAASGDLDTYHLLHAVRADMLRRIGSTEEAAKSYTRALEQVTNDSERRFLERRLREVRS